VPESGLTLSSDEDRLIRHRSLECGLRPDVVEWRNQRGTEPRTCKDRIGQHEDEANPRELAGREWFVDSPPFTD
jgi:hypothetical protein